MKCIWGWPVIYEQQSHWIMGMGHSDVHERSSSPHRWRLLYLKLCLRSQLKACNVTSQHGPFTHPQHLQESVFSNESLCTQTHMQTYLPNSVKLNAKSQQWHKPSLQLRFAILQFWATFFLPVARIQCSFPLPCSTEGKHRCSASQHQFTMLRYRRQGSCVDLKPHTLALCVFWG